MTTDDNNNGGRMAELYYGRCEKIARCQNNNMFFWGMNNEGTELL